MNLLTLLRSARWLSTRQLHRRFFPDATLDAARKRLRRLTAGKYLTMLQQNRMTEALFTLGSEGKRALEKVTDDPVALERKPPTQLEHFQGINDLRIAAELSGSLSYFFACWELSSLGWRYSLIPDAVFAFGDRTFAVEFDRGMEGIEFFVRTKIALYRRGLEGFPLTGILIVTDRAARMATLAKAVGDTRGRVLFSTLGLVREHGMLAPVFFREVDGAGVSLSHSVLSDSLPARTGQALQAVRSEQVAGECRGPLKGEATGSIGEPL